MRLVAFIDRGIVGDEGPCLPCAPFLNVPFYPGQRVDWVTPEGIDGTGIYCGRKRSTAFIMVDGLSRLVRVPIRKLAADE